MAEETPRGRSVMVRYVIDGDTIVTNTGEHLRYIGIDTPEKGEYFFKEAREKNRTLLLSGAVRIVECGGEKKDRYGRTLVWVYAGDVLVNGELLRGGYAKVMQIPPCGLEKRVKMERLAWQAQSLGRGIWKKAGGVKRASQVTPTEASWHIGEMVTVRGVVRSVRKTKRAIFIDFGGAQRRAFTAVIFSGHWKVFEDAGIRFSSYKGKKLSVTGIMRLYKGRPEIIIVSLDQLRS
ncbi:MAG: thermonuclease family protein [Thermodesulfobacteriota bacterium]